MCIISIKALIFMNLSIYDNLWLLKINPIFSTILFDYQLVGNHNQF